MEKLTQTNLAISVGIAQSFLSEIIAGKKRPSPAVAERLEGATGKHRLYWLYPGEFSEDGTPVTKGTPCAQQDG